MANSMIFIRISEKGMAFSYGKAACKESRQQKGADQ